MSWISATSLSMAGVGDARLRAERRDDGDLRIDLGLALAHGEVAPDAGMGLGRVPVELRHVGDRAARGCLVGVRA